jgi:hypothetical protein
LGLWNLQELPHEHGELLRKRQRYGPRRGSWWLRRGNGSITGEGRKRAKARGVRFGPPSVLTPHQRTEVLTRLVEGDSCADIARSYNVDRSTISRLKLKPGTATA